MRRVLFSFAIASLVMVSPTYASRILVPQDQATLQAAIDAAASGDTILVASGTYSGDGNRDLDLETKQGLVFWAPYGNSTTTIDLQGSAGQPHRLCSLQYSERNVSFDGFSIRNGYATDGGVVKCEYQNTPLNFQNCAFRNNHATNGGVLSAGIPNLLNCHFEDNDADNYSGVLDQVTSGGHAKLCRFIHNSAHYGGVSAHCSQFVFDSCDFTGNSASEGSVLDIEFDSDGNTFNYCLIAGNQGLVFSVVNAGVVLDHCTITGNSTDVFAITDASAGLKYCIGAYNGGALAACYTASWEDDQFLGTVHLTSCCLFANGANSADCAQPQVDTNGNFYANPLFCHDGTDFRLQTNSPCATAGPNSTPIGARQVGCESTDVQDDNPPLAYTFELSQNYPNPFNPVTVIRYSLGRKSTVHLKVYNLLGQVVTELVNEEQPAGDHEISWDGTSGDGKSVASGLYFYRLEAGKFVESKKMILLK